MLERLPMRRLYHGVLWLFVLLVSLVCLPRLKPGLNQVFGGFFHLEITPSLAVTLICLLGCAEWLRRSSYVGFVSMWVLTFDSQHLQPGERLQYMVKPHRHEIWSVAGICWLADWLFIIIPMLLVPVLLLTVPSVAGFPVGEILVLPAVALLLERFIEPFRYAIWAVVYSNWRSQHWREG